MLRIIALTLLLISASCSAFITPVYSTPFGGESSPRITIAQINPADYFASSQYAVLTDACHDDETSTPEDCRAALDTLISIEKDPWQVKRLTLLLALEYFDNNEPEKARELFLKLDGAYPLIDDYLQYYLGETAFQMGDWPEARSRFAAIPADSRLHLQARFRLAFCLVRLKDPVAREELEKLLVRNPNHWRIPQVKLELAGLILRYRRDLARELLLDVMKSEPDIGFSKVARDRLASFGLTPLRWPEKIEVAVAQASWFMRRYEYRKAQRWVEQVMPLFPRNDITELKGQALLALARAQFSRRRYTDAIATYRRVNQTRLDDGPLGEALYERLDAHLRKSEVSDTLRLGHEFLERFPNHEKACHTRYLMGKAYKKIDETGQARAVFAELARRHPDCRHALDAQWYVGWLHFREGQFSSAKAYFSKLALNDVSRFERERGLYWLGRIALLRNKKTDAARIWLSLVTDYPLSYYSILAGQRLQEIGAPLPGVFSQKADLTGFALSHDLNQDITPLARNPHFAKGMEWLALGRKKEARREFSALQKAFPERDEIGAFLAYLYTLAGDIYRTVQLSRTTFNSYTKVYPGVTHRSQWRLAYPTPYREEVLTRCKEVGLDPMLLFALMREESSFHAEIRSFANAVGLTQIIRSTGRAIARQLGVKHFKLDDLTEPDTAIRFGSHHLSDLIKRFNGNHALAISSYNAGPGAVNRWRNELGDIPMDVFVEEIPYTETRRYTRRVLKAYGIYRHLYTADQNGFELWRTVNEK